MQEKSKDRVEAVATWGLESTLALIPGVGTSLAMAFSRSLAVADAERVQRQIRDLYETLDRAIREGRIGSDALKSEAFLANIHFVIRQLQETSDATKQARLKHALTTGATRRWKNYGELFTRIITRVEEPHIEALGALITVSRGVGVKRQPRLLNGTVKVMKHLSEKGVQRPEGYYRILFEQLSAESLVVVNGESDVLDQVTGKAVSSEEKARLNQGVSLKATATGAKFVRFLQEPLEGPLNP